MFCVRVTFLQDASPSRPDSAGRDSALQSDHTPLPRLVSAECASSRRYTKVCNPRLVPLTAANHPQAPPELRAALAVITRHADDYAARARLPRAA